MQLALDCRTVDGKGQPGAQGHLAIPRLERYVSQCYRFANPASEPDVQRPDHRDAHQAGPRDTARDPSRLRTDLEDVVMGEEVIRPLRGRVNRKRCDGNRIGAHEIFLLKESYCWDD